MTMKGANFLEKLLDNQPVEWKKIGEVAELKRGKTITQKEAQKGNFPVISGGQKPAYYINQFNREGQTITIAGSGAYAGFVQYWEEPIFVSDAFSLKANEEYVLAKFIYHFLLNIQDKLYHLKRGSGVPHVYAKDVAEFPIPIPPLSVQSRIVEILDKFTSLEAELDCRKRQYIYYRELLLDFSQHNNIQWKKLGEVFYTRNGYTPSKSNPEYWEGGTIPWYRMEDIRENGRILSDALQHITPKGVKGNRLFKADSIILATSATIGEHALITTKALANQRFTNFEIKEDFKEKLLPKFVFYYFYVIDDWCKNHIYIGNFPSVDVEQVKKMDFPLPPLSEQQRIVEILDKFDTLTNSISEGLPLEIQLRRQQYEYYREQLLDFRRF